MVKEKRRNRERSGERGVVVSEERPVRRRPNPLSVLAPVMPVIDVELHGIQYLNAECLEHVLMYVRRRGKWHEASLVCKEWHAQLVLLELREREGCRFGLTCRAKDGERVARLERLDPDLGTARLLLQVTLLRTCPLHTRALVLRDASWLEERDYEVLGAFARTLSALTIEKCHTLRGGSVAQLVRYGNALRSLHLTVASGLDDKGAAVLARGCPRLSELRLLGCYKLTGEGLMTLLRECNRLKHLELNSMAYKRPPQGLAVPKVPNGESWKLKVLALTCTDVVTDELLVAMAPRLRNLQQLDLTGCRRVTGAGVWSVVKQCQNRLSRLKLRGCAVGDPVLEQLAGSEAELQLVSVKDAAVTDQGLRALLRSRKNALLRQLCVSKSGVTDRGLTYMGNNAAAFFFNLKVIDVQECPGVSRAQEKELRKELLDIERKRISVVSSFVHSWR